MSKRPPLSDMRILLATWFGSGYAPFAPGTFGSLFALPIGWALAKAHPMGSANNDPNVPGAKGA